MIHPLSSTFSFYTFGYSGTGLGQVQLKLGDFKSSLGNFEKVLEVYPDNCETLKVSIMTATMLVVLA